MGRSTTGSDTVRRCILSAGNNFAVCMMTAQCSLKRGRTQARFRKKFLSDDMLQHKIL